MKSIALLFAAFSITLLGIIGAMKPEILTFSSADEEVSPAVPVDAPAKIEQERPTPKTKKKIRRVAAYRESAEEKEFEEFMRNFNTSSSSELPHRGRRASEPPKGLVAQKRPATPLKVSDWRNSGPLSIGTLRGHIVVLNFWATWCSPCIKSIPHNNELHLKYREQGVVLIGVCATSGAEDMASIATGEDIHYPIAKDEKGRTRDDYEVNSYPTFCVIDRNGDIRFSDLRARDVETAIEHLLTEEDEN